MRRFALLGSLVGLVFVLAVVSGSSVRASTAAGDGIDVAPNVLNIASSGTVVSIHTNVPYSSVVGATVTLNGVPIDWWKSDSQGDFVAKFVMDEVKALTDVTEDDEDDEDNEDLTPLTVNEYNTLTLSGLTKTDEIFGGSQEILVIDNEASGKR